MHTKKLIHKPQRQTRRRRSAGKKPRTGEPQGARPTALEPQGLQARTINQSGDAQGLSSVAMDDSESVGLAEEGQDPEAELISNIESAPNADRQRLIAEEINVEASEDAESTEQEQKLGENEKASPKGTRKPKARAAQAF